jgi:hypothetical protein
MEGIFLQRDGIIVLNPLAYCEGLTLRIQSFSLYSTSRRSVDSRILSYLRPNGQGEVCVSVCVCSITAMHPESIGRCDAPVNPNDPRVSTIWSYVRLLDRTCPDCIGKLRS